MTYDPRGPTSGRQFGRRQATVKVEEPLLSRRRLRPLIIVFAVPILLISVAVAYYLNQDFLRQSLTDEVVETMLKAPSYRATGVETTRGGGGDKEVREQFEYISPNRIHSVYRQSSSGGFSSFVTSDSLTSEQCNTNEVVMIGGSGYRRCADTGSMWETFTADPGTFSTLQFQPWRRVDWCTEFEEEEPTVLGGQSVRVLSCQVPNSREATVIYGAVGSSEKERFIQEADIQVTVWVREVDGYIARFAMNRTAPGDVVTTLDYAYADFGSVPEIVAPDTSTNVVAPDVGEEPSAPDFVGMFSGDNTPTVAIINGQSINLEVANDGNSRSQGLSKRPLLPEDQGMLFVFEEEAKHGFWMKDVRFPLDVLYINANGIITDIVTMDIQPGVLDDDLIIYRPTSDVPFALEINGGKAAELGFETGMQVQFQ